MSPIDGTIEPGQRPSFVGDVAQDLRFTWRTLRRQPLVGAAVVLIIGLAIGANAAIFSVVDAVALRPLALPDSDASRFCGRRRFAASRRAAWLLPTRWSSNASCAP